jgi:hypothetical protein
VVGAAPPARPGSQRAALWIFVFALAATAFEGAALHVNALHFAGFMLDFRAFYCAGAALDAGADPYRAEPLRSCEVDAYGAFPQGYPQVAVPAPLPGYALAPFALLARLPYNVAAALWLFAIILAIAASAVLLIGLSRLPAPVVWAALLLPVGLVSGFLGQLVPFALLALVVCARALEAERPQLAVLAGVASLIEPHFVLPVCLGLAVGMPRARLPLGVLLAAAAALSFVLLGVERNLEYVRAVLPAHLASEVGNEEQYSLTHLLNLAGVPDSLALQLGSLSYILAIAAGAFFALRLVRHGAPRSLFVLLPAAFAPLGGSFVHLQQMAFVIPALLVLLGRVALRDAWLGSALLLLALPFGNFTFLFVTAPFALATVVVLGREQLRLSWLVVLSLGVTVLAALCGLTAAFIPRPDVHAAVAAAAGADRLAEATWDALIRSSYHSNVALFTLSKVPTYAALTIFAIVTLRLALARRDGGAPVEPERAPCVA